MSQDIKSPPLPEARCFLAVYMEWERYFFKKALTNELYEILRFRNITLFYFLIFNSIIVDLQYANLCCTAE